jgi:hypothetical protein
LFISSLAWNVYKKAPFLREARRKRTEMEIKGRRWSDVKPVDAIRLSRKAA